MKINAVLILDSMWDVHWIWEIINAKKLWLNSYIFLTFFSKYEIVIF